MSKDHPLYQLNDFARAYVGAALWDTTDERDGGGGSPLERSFDGTDIAPETIAVMAADCKRFEEENAETLAAAYEIYPSGGDGQGPESHAGYDFWLTRKGAGVGFWDRGLGELGDKLTAAAKKFGEHFHLWVDGKFDTEAEEWEEGAIIRHE